MLRKGVFPLQDMTKITHYSTGEPATANSNFPMVLHLTMLKSIPEMAIMVEKIIF